MKEIRDLVTMSSTKMVNAQLKTKKSPNAQQDVGALLQIVVKKPRLQAIFIEVGLNSSRCFSPQLSRHFIDACDQCVDISV